MDESGVHQGAKQTVMAGYIGYSGAWRQFEKKWKRMLASYEIPYFHAKDIYQKTDMCLGWSVDKGNRLFRKSERISHAHSIFGFVVLLSHSEYNARYKLNGNRIKGTGIPDSKYGLCFRMAMSAIIPLVERKLQKRKGPHTLHVVMEAGHNNAGDVERIFHLMKSRHSPESVRSLLGDLSFGEKAECCGTQAADGLAYTAYGIEKRSVPEVVAHSVTDDIWDRTNEIVVAQRRGAGRKVVPIFRLPFVPDQLIELKTHLFLKDPVPTFAFR